MAIDFSGFTKSLLRLVGISEDPVEDDAPPLSEHSDNVSFTNSSMYPIKEHAYIHHYSGIYTCPTICWIFNNFSDYVATLLIFGKHDVIPLLAPFGHSLLSIGILIKM